MIALSLPVDVVLVVKEHPWMVGKRSLKSYRKMLNIPRVILANPNLDVRVLIKKAMAVTVITGSVGLEAAMLGKNVITFGDCPFNLLPMVNQCKDPRNLPSMLRDAISQKNHDRKSLISYISAVFETSVAINLYSVLLSKQNVYCPTTAESFDDEINRLADYLIKIENSKVV
jgi:capsule polysaccharide export protein KpsC/LpsZ